MLKHSKERESRAEGKKRKEKGGKDKYNEESGGKDGEGVVERVKEGVVEGVEEGIDVVLRENSTSQDQNGECSG